MVTFPQAVLGIEADIYLGSWTDASTYLYQRAPVSITRGRQSQSVTMSPSQLTMTVDNRDGRWTIRNPTGAWYGSLVQNTPLRISVPNSLTGGGTYLRLEDDTVSYWAANDSSGLQITSSLDIFIDLAPSGYQACMLAYKWGGNGKAWQLELNDDGTLTLNWYDGTSSHAATSTAALPHLGRIVIRVSLDCVNGNVGFKTAPSMTGTQTQLGSVISVGTTSVSAAAGQALRIGHNSADPGSPSVTGSIYEFRLYDGLDGSGGTLAADPVFSGQTAGATSFTDAQGNDWYAAGTAELSDRLYRFHGELSALPRASDPSDTDRYAQATASGIMRRLSQQQSNAGSAMYRAYVRLDSSLNLAAYWPMEDGKYATQIGSGLSGGSPMTISGTPTLASNSDFACSQPLPVVNGATFTGPVAGTGITWTDNVVRFLLEVPSGGDTNNAVLIRYYTTGTVHRVDLIYGSGTGGSLTLSGFDAAGTQLFTSGAYGFTPSLNGVKMRVSADLVASGANITWQMQTLQGDSAESFASGTYDTATIGAVTSVVINPGGALKSTVIGQCSVQGKWDALLDMVNPLIAWLGETAGARFARLCSEEGYNCRIIGFPADSVAMGYQTPQTMPALLTECETTDQGMMFEPRQVLGLGYVCRSALYNQAVTATAVWTSSELAAAFQATSDDLSTINDVTVTNADSSTAREVLASGAMSVQDPPDGIGRVDTSIQVNASSDSDLATLANWILHCSTVDDDRYPSLPFDMARSQTPDTIPLLDIGSYLQVTDTPEWVPPGPVRQLCAGFTEALGPFGVWQIGVNGMPESPYEVAVVGTAKADTAGSELAGAGMTATASSFGGNASAGSTSLWTTDSSQAPFDILMGGERMTVTAVTGTAGQWLAGENAGFEGGTGTWGNDGTNLCTVADTSAQAHSGSDSMSLTSAVASGNMYASHCLNGSPASVIANAMPCAPGDTVTASAWFRAATVTRSCRVVISFWTAAGAYISGSYPAGSADATTGWTQESNSAVAPADTAYARAEAWVMAVGSIGEIHYVDDVTLADTTNPPQTFTVTRSVNGVTKAHTAGESFALYDTPVVAL